MEKKYYTHKTEYLAGVPVTSVYFKQFLKQQNELLRNADYAGWELISALEYQNYFFYYFKKEADL